VKVPADAVRVDVKGKTIIPGLINAHGHVDAARDSTVSVRDQLLAQLRLYAQYGVTTAFSLGSTANDALEGIKLRDEQEQTTLDRARLYTSGVVIADPTPDAARKSVDRNADQKVDIIKIRVDGDDSSPNKMKPDVYRAVIDEAHKRGFRVASHLYYLKDAMGLLDAGTDIIAHSVRDQDVTPEFIAAVKKRNVGYIPTLTRDLSVFVYESTPAFFSDPFFLRGKAMYARQMAQLSDPAMQAKTRASKDAQTIKVALQQANRNLKIVSDAGIPIAMGTDTGANLMGRWQGFFEHMELEMMVKGGMTPMQTLVAATGGAARVMKIDAQLGTLQPGKWADFVVLGANPLTDIRNTRQIDSVWIAGRRLSTGS
jgi:imidazolonepropionase-like amidohydrolase